MRLFGINYARQGYLTGIVLGAGCLVLLKYFKDYALRDEKLG